jgi:chemotaxis family two-component system response regulator Rcp1
LSNIQQSTSIEILLVEDNPGDVRLTQEALKESKLSNNLIVARDGQEAWDILNRMNGHEGATIPDLILLDLNMPRVDGRELLGRLKEDAELKHIPVVILTTSESEEDVLRSYQLYANCYVSKPVGLGEFLEVVKSISDFWLSIVKLPTKTKTEVPEAQPLF